MPKVRGFGCLELCLYGIRQLGPNLDIFLILTCLFKIYIIYVVYNSALGKYSIPLSLVGRPCSRSSRSLHSFSSLNNNGSQFEPGESLLTLENNLKASETSQHCYWDQRLQESVLYNSTMEYLHYIDSVSRKLFPATFLLCNLIYWTSYIYVL